MSSKLKNRCVIIHKYNGFISLLEVKLSQKPLNYITCNVKNKGLTKSGFYFIVFTKVTKGTVTKYSW